MYTAEKKKHPNQVGRDMSGENTRLDPRFVGMDGWGNTADNEEEDDTGRVGRRRGGGEGGVKTGGGQREGGEKGGGR